MKVTAIKNQMHMEEWAKLIDERQLSGLTIKEWCLRNDLPESRYYYYLKKLRMAACESLSGADQNGAQFALAPKQALISNPAVVRKSNIKITLPNAVIEIGEGADEAQVGLVLEVLLNAQ